MNWWQIVITILGSGGFTAIISYFINRRFNNKKLHAEIISKARIDWINEFRELSSKYLYEGFRSIEEGKTICQIDENLETIPRGTDKRGKIENDLNNTFLKYNEHINNMTKYSIQIRLYLPERPNNINQEEHEKIKDDIQILSVELNHAIKKRDVELFKTIQQVDMQNLVDYISKYLKKEWDRAKNKE